MQRNKSSSTFLSEHPDDAKSLNDDDDARLTSLLNASMPELLQQIPDMRDITEYWIIYPHKIQVPLHKDDLLYESKRNYSSALNLGELPAHVD